MLVQALDHVNIRVTDMEATAAFFVDVLGMERSTERATWLLDASGHPAIHLGRADGQYPSDALRPFTPRSDSGAVHHVALSCSGYDEVVARLEVHGHEYSINRVAADFMQVFVVEPGGVLLELNFRG